MRVLNSIILEQLYFFGEAKKTTTIRLNNSFHVIKQSSVVDA